MPRKRLLALPLACALLAAPAAAEEAGAVQLDIAGESYEFPLWASQSDWSGSEQFGSVNIYTKAGEAARAAGLGTFTLGFSLQANGADTAEVSLRRDETKLFGNDDQGGMSVTLDSATVEGEFLTIEGRFEGPLGPSEDYGRTIDLSDPTPVSGDFTVTLGPV